MPSINQSRDLNQELLNCENDVLNSIRNIIYCTFSISLIPKIIKLHKSLSSINMTPRYTHIHIHVYNLIHIHIYINSIKNANPYYN